MSFPSRKGVSKSVSVEENKQFFIRPLAVNLILLQLSQKGLETVLITPKEPLYPLIFFGSS